MTLHHNCLKDNNFSWTDIGMYKSIRKFECIDCGSIWSETKKEVLKDDRE